MVNSLFILLIVVLVVIGIGFFIIAASAAQHPPVIIIPNSVTLGEGVRIYLVNTMITVPPQQPFRVGEEIDFSWAVQNTGTVTLTNVVVTSELRAGVSNFHSPDCTISGSTVACLIPDLGPSERYPVNGFFDFFVTIEPELADTFYRNTGKVCGQYQDIIYCTTDRSAVLIQPLEVPSTPDPIPSDVEEQLAYLKMKVEELESRLGILEQSWTDFQTAWRNVFG